MLMPATHHTNSEEETAQLAASLATQIRAGDILCLHGTLGMGKSVFARALIRALCDDPHLDVPSPTFTLVQHYEAGETALWHFDLYRLENPEDIYEIGWEEALENGILLVEWPERLSYLTPKNCINIMISKGIEGATCRLISIMPSAEMP